VRLDFGLPFAVLSPISTSISLSVPSWCEIKGTEFALFDTLTLPGTLVVKLALSPKKVRSEIVRISSSACVFLVLWGEEMLVVWEE
jgi:hypothetical protein